MQGEYTRVDFNNQVNPSSGFDLVSLSRVLGKSYANHSPLAFHQVEFFILVIYQGGKGKHTIDFVDYDCVPGTVMAIRKDKIHKFSESDLEGTLLLFTDEFLGSYYAETEAHKSLLLFNEFLHSPRIQLSGDHYEQVLALIRRMQEEYEEVNDAHSLGIIRSELQILLSKLYRIATHEQTSTSQNKHLSEFIRFQNCIEERFTRSLKVKDYAKWLGLTTKALNAATQSIINKSAKAFIDEICLNHIKRQLISAEKSIKEISYQSGFEEPANFHNYFKKRVGVTAAQYRKANQ